MTLRISGKQMEIGDAFRTRIEERIGEAVEKYFDGGFSGRVTVEKTGARFDTDCTLHIDTGLVLQSTGRGMDPQVSFEEAAEKLEKRLRRYKRRLKSHHRDTSTQNEDMTYRIMSPVADEDEEVPVDYAPTIVAESTMSLAPMSVASAVIELDTKESPVFVFRNSANDHVNIVYRRADGNIGWIDPSAGSQAAE